ncbi:DUF3710 domain-containing protein [Propionibacteriaceae bacterium Y2011]
MIFDRLFGKRGGSRSDSSEEEHADTATPAEAEVDEDHDAVDEDHDAVDEERDAVDEAHTGADAPADDTDWDAFDARWWRDDGPYDLSEVDAELLDEPDPMRIDLGSLIVTGFEGMELRLQVSEETQQVMSALLIKGDSALEIAAFAAPRSGGLWSELREEIVTATNEAGGSVAHVKGPFGTELRRLLPVQTPDGEQGYQPSRMWVAQGPRWCLRGVLYGQASVSEGLDGPVAPLLETFRKIVVRRGDVAMAPGDLLELTMPDGARPATPETPRG